MQIGACGRNEEMKHAYRLFRVGLRSLGLRRPRLGRVALGGELHLRTARSEHDAAASGCSRNRVTHKRLNQQKTRTDPEDATNALHAELKSRVAESMGHSWMWTGD